ncbi:zinc finger protein 436-like [Ornithodoros turicata]|uniref:zinc finger protein 436-like n=1 Tax=Ornithodoros turicata TaxID=34597 RepID=UPI0031398CC6
MPLSPEFSGHPMEVKLEPQGSSCLLEEGHIQQPHHDESPPGSDSCGPVAGTVRSKEEPQDESSNEPPITVVKTEPYDIAVLEGQDQMGHSCDSNSQVPTATTGTFHIENEPRDIRHPVSSGCGSSCEQFNIDVTAVEPPLKDTVPVTVDGPCADSKPRDVSPDRNETQGAGKSSATSDKKGRLYKRTDTGHLGTRLKTYKVNAFTCVTCSTTFYRMSAVGANAKLCTSEGPYRCEACTLACMSQVSLKRHSPVHACALSDQLPSASEDQMVRPDASSQSKYATDHTPNGTVCPEEFNQSTQLWHHRRTHTGEEAHKCDPPLATSDSHEQTRADGKPYKCRFCPAGFTNTYNLRVHERTHTGEKPYKCDICPAEFAQSTTLRRHRQTHTGEKPYKCSLCPAEFSQTHHLKNHSRTHTGEKPYKCDLCDAMFIKSTALKRHKRIHTCENPYKCDICSASFSQGMQLWQHKQTHTDAKPYKCDVCPAEFNRKTNLQRHKRTHTGEKPYKCHLCPVEFSQMSNLKDHMWTHTGEKPYKCDRCDAGFSRSTHLKHHLLGHAGKKAFKCNLCDAGFGRGTHLRRHMQIHTGERPYKCDLCPAEFSQMHHLKNHVRTHTGEKPYKCHLCPAQFSQMHHLNGHIRTHSHEKPSKCNPCGASQSDAYSIETG